MFRFHQLEVKLRSETEIEPHEILLDKFAQKKEEKLGVSEQKFEVPLQEKVLKLFLLFTLFLILVIFTKTFQFQVVEGKNLSALAERNKFIIRQIQAERGVIYDKNLNQLVFNQPSFDLICQKNNLPKEEKERAKILKEVAEITGQDFEGLKKEIKESKDSLITILENLDHQTLIILETKIEELIGFQIKNNTVRDYQDGASFCHLIGYKRKTGDRTGLEEFYNEVLIEKPGEILTKRNAEGNFISEEIIKVPESGNSLVLWLDSELQKKIEEELKKRLKETGAEAGTVVALDPKTGGVLSLVSIPNFDNNLFSKGMSEEEWEQISNNPLNPLFNQAISGEYPTGSTIKPLTAAAALEEKIISPEKKIHCVGEISIPDFWNPEKIWKYKDWKVHGWTDMRKAIAQSCNVYFYTIGGGYENQEGLGPTRIKKYLELFGWGEKTGIDLPGEEKGFIPDPAWKKSVKGENWLDGDTYHLSIGQSYLGITPLQMATSFMSIANGGKLFRPQVVKEIVDKDKNLIKEIKPEVIREGFIKLENLEVIREGMKQAVTDGTATGWLDQLNVSSACKTGSAQTEKKGILDNWITVFAPYDEPQIVLTIMIKDVKEGQSVTQPLAQKILEWYFASK